MTGIVKSYDGKRGFGFIQPLIGKPTETAHVFFHITSVLAHKGKRPAGLPIGAEVRFDLVRGERGPQAANVELLTMSAGALRTLHKTGD